MKFSMRKREVHYVVDEICLDDHWFGLEDLIETLTQVEEDDIWIKNRPMADALIKRKVLATSGSGHGYAARIGPKYHAFLTRMEEYKEVVSIK